MDTSTLIGMTQSPSCDDYINVLQWAGQVQQKYGDGLHEITHSFSNCRVRFVSNKLDGLKTVWEALPQSRRDIFKEKYGHIAELLYVNVNESTIKALVNFWNPAYRCFTFGLNDLTPTMEEYHVMLGIPQKNEVKIYCFNPQSTAKRELSRFLATIQTTDIEKHCKIKENEECISLDYMEDLIRTFFDEERGLTLLALCIFGTILFPKIGGYIDGNVVKLFFSVEQRGVNPIIPLLAETFRSLNYCRNQNNGILRCGVSLLYVWIHSHVKCPPEFRCPSISFSQSWNAKRNTIKEFRSAVWERQFLKVDAWIHFFSFMKEENITWRAIWMPTSSMIYRCGQLNCVPLLGPWGSIQYAPLLVMRQLWFKQFVPVTYGLHDLEFSHTCIDTNDKRRRIVNAWKAVKKISDKRHYGGATSEYNIWRLARSTRKTEAPEVERKDHIDQLREDCRRLEGTNQNLESENQRLQEELGQWMDHAAKIQKELDKTREDLAHQTIFEKDFEAINGEAKQLSRDNRALKNQRAKLQEVLNFQEKKISDLDEGRNRLLQVIKDLKITNDSQRARIDKLEEENFSLHKAIDELQEQSKEYETLEKHAHSLNSRLTTIHNANMRISEEYEHLEQELAQVRGDISRFLDRVVSSIETIQKMARKSQELAEESAKLRKRLTLSCLHLDIDDFL